MTLASATPSSFAASRRASALRPRDSNHRTDSGATSAISSDVTIGSAPVAATPRQPITVPENAGTLTITADGVINGRSGQIGQSGVVDVADPQCLQAAGDNQFIANQATTPATRPGIVQGALEQSNVSPVMMITKMMMAR